MRETLQQMFSIPPDWMHKGYFNACVGIMPAATAAHVQSIRVRKDYQKLMRTLACFVDGFKD